MPSKSIEISKLKLPVWVKWIAQDADGAWWGYECEPLQYDKGWYENEVGRRLKLFSTEANTDWISTLTRIKKA